MPSEVFEKALANIEVVANIDVAIAAGTKIQTLIFSKEKFKTADQAKKWAKDHNFKSGKVDETGESFRLRQVDPGKFKKGSLRTISLTDGVKSVIGTLS